MSSKTINISKPTKPIVFKVKDLNFWYKNGDKQALININLDIYSKEVLALIGPSGCGKSTFLRCLNRMNDTIAGTKLKGLIELENKNIYSKKQSVIALRTHVGMVFQKANPFPMSIYENVAFGPRAHGVKSKKVLDKLVKDALISAALWDEVSDILTHLATDLSGGQQQRLCIARAIAMRPEVLLMDEPTSALDPIATKKIEALILELKRNYTIIIVTHSMQQAARISDKAAFFYLGKLIETDKTKKIFTAPRDKKTDDYIRGRQV